MYKRSKQDWTRHLDFIAIDALVLQLSFVLAYWIRHSANPYATSSYRSLAIMLVVVDVFVAANFETMNGVLKRGYAKEAIQTLKQAVLVLLITALYMYSMQIGDVYSRIAIYLMTVFYFVLGYVTRVVLKPVMQHLGRRARKSTMVLVADEGQVSKILGRISPTDDVAYKGIVLTNRDGTGEEIEGIPVVASLQNAADYICREWVDEVFVYPAHLSDIETHKDIAFEGAEEFVSDIIGDVVLEDYKGEADPGDTGNQATVADIIEACRQMSIPTHICLPLSTMGGKSFVERVGGYTVLTSTSNYATPLQVMLKRIMDILGGLVGSVIALFVIAVVGIQIKREDPGPILFKQERIGQNGKRFQILKIRSMYTDAEERKQELLEQNRVTDGMMFKLDWDPRIIGNKIVDGKQVTGIGEKIRSGSWDEWPQFFNILRGDMSLVGTRPPTVDEWEKYRYHHRARLATKPGLTGMWQVSGRSRITDFEEVVKLDTEYINHWSIGLDLRILLRTIKVVLLKDGAM